MYIIPEYSDIKSKILLDNQLEWNGVLFIKEGAYKKGIFKFTIQIPQSYPSKPPIVIFSTKVIHPLIDSKSWILDIKVSQIDY
jgi:ubiquitin-protein ligase